jgi:hypothetical protein
VPFRDKEAERAYNKEYRRTHPKTLYKNKTESEKEAARAKSREYQSQYRKRPEVRERFRGYIQKYKENNLETLREKARIRDRANRADPVKLARVKENSIRHKKRLKELVVEHYSKGKKCCSWCPESRLPCLSIDHIDGGGNAHRRSIRLKAGINFYNWLKREGFPSGFRVLCMNCQFMSLHEMRRRKRELHQNQHC